MGPHKKKQDSLGRSLQKRKLQNVYTSSRHTAEGDEAPMISVTETTSIADFLTNAEAARRSFEAERGRAAITNVGVEPEDDIPEESAAEAAEEEEAEFCSIPKKPVFKDGETAEEFQQREVDAFLNWKRTLARLQARNPKLPPFEKNLEFWKQLWKIIELSDVVVQVVDARDPLFYFSHDLATYVKEVDETKETVLLLNKADLLTPEQRSVWSDYFRESDTKALFFSASEEYAAKEEVEEDGEIEIGCSKILQPAQVLNVMKNVIPEKTTVTVGFTGYPNVGKSSTINRFLTSKKLRVSATPGKTKHFQTHVIGGSCVFIDGPGLVIPNLNMDKAAMVLGGILPIDNLTEYMTSMDLMLTKVPFAYLLKHYGIMKSCVLDAKKSERKISDSMLFLSSFGLMRGFVKGGGVPDQARAARVVLKDFVTGKLRFCQAPPSGVDQLEFCPYNTDCDEEITASEDLELEESFPELKLASGVHMRGRRHVAVNGNPLGSVPKQKRHSNAKKREKAKRVYGDNPYA